MEAGVQERGDSWTSLSHACHWGTAVCSPGRGRQEWEPCEPFGEVEAKVRHMGHFTLHLEMS